MGSTAAYFDYDDLDFDIRSDIPEAYQSTWNKIANPGNWWRGADRIAIASEVRNARDCKLCRERKAALSPFSVEGTHTHSNNLPELAIDAVHRLSTDASRLTQTWLKDCEANGLSNEQYVELLGVVVAVISIDAFHRALGIPLERLPEPIAGEPSRIRPTTNNAIGAWLPTVPVDAAIGSEADLYNGNRQAPNVVAAMSLVPDNVRMLKILSAAQYLPLNQLTVLESNGGRAISRAQIELLAGRVSSQNDCFY